MIEKTDIYAGFLHKCRFLELLAGLVPLAETPRLAIINCQLCLSAYIPPTTVGKAFCSRKTAPPSTLVGSRYSPKQKSTTWVLFVLEQATRVELVSKLVQVSFSTYLVY